jgi:hypothetical protein
LIAGYEDNSYQQNVYDDYEPGPLIQKHYDLVYSHGLPLSNIKVRVQFTRSAVRLLKANRRLAVIAKSFGQRGAIID